MKNNWKTSSGESEIGTVGPTVDLKGWMVTGFRPVVHILGRSSGKQPGGVLGAEW